MGLDVYERFTLRGRRCNYVAGIFAALTTNTLGERWR